MFTFQGFFSPCSCLFFIDLLLFQSTVVLYSTAMARRSFNTEITLYRAFSEIFRPKMEFQPYLDEFWDLSNMDTSRLSDMVIKYNCNDEVCSQDDPAGHMDVFSNSYPLSSPESLNLMLRGELKVPCGSCNSASANISSFQSRDWSGFLSFPLTDEAKEIDALPWLKKEFQLRNFDTGLNNHFKLAYLTMETPVTMVPGEDVVKMPSQIFPRGLCNEDGRTEWYFYNPVATKGYLLPFEACEGHALDCLHEFMKRSINGWVEANSKFTSYNFYRCFSCGKGPRFPRNRAREWANVIASWMSTSGDSSMMAESPDKSSTPAEPRRKMKKGLKEDQERL